MKKITFFIYSNEEKHLQKFLEQIPANEKFAVIYPTALKCFSYDWHTLEHFAEALKDYGAHVMAIPEPSWFLDKRLRDGIALWGTVIEQDADTVCVILPEELKDVWKGETGRKQFLKRMIEPDMAHALVAGDIFSFDMSEDIPCESHVEKDAVAA